jgi:predicted MFS family arabinose efflux permease
LLLALACYPFVDGFYSLLAIRLFNGVGFAGLFCSLVALSPYAFDAERSGHAFSIISMVCLLPFIIVPPLLSPAEKLFGFGLTVFLAGLPMAFFAPLATIAFRKHGDALGSEASVPLPLRRCLIGLKRPWLLALLFATATFYYTYAWVFYNAFGLSTKAGIANPGDLLSLASLCTILFRVIVGRRLDGAWRPALLAGALILNALAAFLLAACSLPKWGYYVDFALFGLAWGAAVPLLLSAVMERSPKDEQGFNLNASSQMQDAGYFLGPMLGGFFASEYLLALLGALTVMAVLGGWRARDKV